MIVIECDPLVGVPSYESWWDVPVAEVSEQLPVEQARRTYERELVLSRNALKAAVADARSRGKT